MSIASEIQRIKGNIEDAYTECENKGATLPQNQNSDNLATTIASISGGGGADLDNYFNRTIDTASTSSLSWLQSKLVKRIPTLTINNDITKLNYSFSRIPFFSIYFDGVDFSNITSIAYILAYTTALQSLDISNFINTNLGRITNASYMFYGDTNLETITGMFPLTGTVDIRYCFQNCRALKKIDLSNWEITPSSTDGTSIFENCYKVAIIDISKINFQGGYSFASTFRYAGRDCLQTDGAYADGIPYVYVKDATTQTKILTVRTDWSTNNVVIKSN